MADDALLTTLAAALLAVAATAVGHLYRRLHEMRDRIRDIEATLATLQPIIQALREASQHDALALLKGGRRRA